jgi:hypothetical protein
VEERLAPESLDVSQGDAGSPQVDNGGLVENSRLSEASHITSRTEVDANDNNGEDAELASLGALSDFGASSPASGRATSPFGTFMNIHRSSPIAALFIDSRSAAPTEQVSTRKSLVSSKI